MNKFGRIGLLAAVASAAMSGARPAETASGSGRHRGREPKTMKPASSGKTSGFTSQRL